MDAYQQYRERYDTLDTIVVYDFRREYGGIGDLVKFFMHALHLCMKNDIRLCYAANNLVIDKYLRLVDDRMYIRMDTPLFPLREIKESDFANLSPGVYHLVTPFTFYYIFDYSYISVPIDRVFTFSDEVRENAERVLPDSIGTSYISVHLRVGDKYLDTDPAFLACPDDVRSFSERVIYNHLVSKLRETRVVFVCDNQTFKNKVREWFPSILAPNTIIGHTSLENTTEQQILDAVTEFYTVVHGKEVHMASESGFPRVAAAFRGIPVVTIQ
jgi:hypothetical protein